MAGALPEELPYDPGPDERNWAMFCHLSVFAGLLFPFGNVIAPLVLWLLKRRESAFVDFHGKEVLNFQITLLLGFAVCWVLTLVIIGLVLMVVLALAALVLTIIGLVRASRGECWRYPLSLRLVS
ncbi:orotate phosphoribosyltransferase [Zobellella denitrificans]|jgi:hypothetical protein|uniref:DUF4870 domain-containing protein n=1 Tax=Zobellella denitrificans TaxID=347534 RepID=UPI000B8C0809|nr:DUF4870 domain-containing protein [Zobellella denitrificans]OXS14101.1 orotate phosphoribosyltransferase [Zobellella denitrificans]